MGWVEGVFVEGVPCEDAPCCGCCGPHGDGPDRLGGEDEPYDPDDYLDYGREDDLEAGDPVGFDESPDPGWTMD